jgi:hypothetical protein
MIILVINKSSGHIKTFFHLGNLTEHLGKTFSFQLKILIKSIRLSSDQMIF